METSLIKNTDIYLDYNATTPVDPEVFKAMEPYFKQHFGNPSSASHHWGWAADNAVAKAREQIAQLIGAGPQEITFTAGATEANNQVIFGLINKVREENPSEPIHIISSSLEHDSVMKSLLATLKQNVEVDFLDVDKFGRVDLEALKTAIKPHTKLITLIWVNNEIGTLNPILDAAQIARERKIYFHTDATQAIGKIPVNLSETAIDMMSFSAHKMYGPKGIGALYLRSKNPKVQIHPLIYGGGQEKGLRSGTLNVPGIVGFGAAADICRQLMPTEKERTQKLRDLLWTELQKAFPGIQLNGHPIERSPINLNVTLPSQKTEQMLPRLQRLASSTGSACGTGTMTLSHVLLGLGVGSDAIQRSLRLSLGRWTTEDEIHQAVKILQHAAELSS